MTLFLCLSLCKYVCKYVCIHMHVYRSGCRSVLCRGQKTALSISSSFHLVWDRVFFCMCAGPNGAQTSWDFSISTFSPFLRNTGIRVECYCAPTFLSSGDSNSDPHAFHCKHFTHWGIFTCLGLWCSILEVTNYVDHTFLIFWVISDTMKTSLKIFFIWFYRIVWLQPSKLVAKTCNRSSVGGLNRRFVNWTPA